VGLAARQFLSLAMMYILMQDQARLRSQLGRPYMPKAFLLLGLLALLLAQMC
jgi:hypothetical protein